LCTAVVAVVLRRNHWHDLRKKVGDRLFNPVSAHRLFFRTQQELPTILARSIMRPAQNIGHELAQPSRSVDDDR
jgi:hypothetical protein